MGVLFYVQADAPLAQLQTVSSAGRDEDFAVSLHTTLPASGGHFRPFLLSVLFSAMAIVLQVFLFFWGVCVGSSIVKQLSRLRRVCARVCERDQPNRLQQQQQQQQQQPKNGGSRANDGASPRKTSALHDVLSHAQHIPPPAVC